MTVPILAQLQAEVAGAKAELERRKPKQVSLPCSATASASVSSAPSGSVASSSMGCSTRKRKGGISPSEKALSMDIRNELDAIIAKMFYSMGM